MCNCAILNITTRIPYKHFKIIPEYVAQITVCEKMVSANFTIKPMNKEVRGFSPLIVIVYKTVSQAMGTPKLDKDM